MGKIGVYSGVWPYSRFPLWEPVKVPMFQAIRNGDVAFVKAHLTKAEIEVRDRRGATPLMHAAAFGISRHSSFCWMRSPM